MTPDAQRRPGATPEPSSENFTVTADQLTAALGDALDDMAWFARNPRRHVRMGPLRPAERAHMANLAPGRPLTVTVRKIGDRLLVRHYDTGAETLAIVGRTL